MVTNRPLSPSKAAEIAPGRKPDWLRIRAPGGAKYTEIKEMLRTRKLATVCEEARCPNISECWSGGTATFMLGGDTCTRACRFCAVKTARRPPALDPEEPVHVADTVAELGLRYVVITMVDRDDMADGGAGHFAATVRELKGRQSDLIVEALVSDFRGDLAAIRTVVDSLLDVYAHNIETVKELQYRVRDPRAGYEQSLKTLVDARAYAHGIGHSLYTKSSIMLGLGETVDQLKIAFEDLRRAEVDVLTLGQYLRPTRQHLPVEKFYTPDEFKELEELAMTYDFMYVASGPFVRSSYKAAEFFLKGVVEKNRQRNRRKESEDGIQGT